MGNGIQAARLGCELFKETKVADLDTDSVGQLGFFRQAGSTEVSRVVLNLNHYATSRGTDWGTQEWVQMVYRAPPERRARSISPELRGGRQR